MWRRALELASSRYRVDEVVLLLLRQQKVPDLEMVRGT